MFLTKDNQIKWRKMCVAAIVTLILVFAGIFWFDKPLYMFMRGFDCGLWVWFDVFLAPKVWIVATFVAAMVFCAKKCVKKNCDFLNPCGKGNLFGYVRNFFVNTKTNNAFLIFYSVLVAGIVAKVLKTFIGRARPIFFEALDMTGFFPPSLDWAFNSMPSGHTAVSFAGLVMIGMLAPRFKAITWTLAIVIGASRVAIGAHWPSDVILGAFIGMVAADIIKGRLLRKK